MSLVNHPYWLMEEAGKHHRARLVALNKVFPRVPQI
jgi:hypothetical protein